MHGLRFTDLCPEIPLFETECPEITAHGIATMEAFDAEFCTTYFRHRTIGGTLYRVPVLRLSRPIKSAVSSRFISFLNGSGTIIKPEAIAH